MIFKKYFKIKYQNRLNFLLLFPSFLKSHFLLLQISPPSHPPPLQISHPPLHLLHKPFHSPTNPPLHHSHIPLRLPQPKQVQRLPCQLLNITIFTNLKLYHPVILYRYHYFQYRLEILIPVQDRCCIMQKTTLLTVLMERVQKIPSSPIYLIIVVSLVISIIYKLLSQLN